MEHYANKPSAAWTLFTYVQFAIAAAMMGGGIFFLEASFAAKGFYAMAAIMLVSSTAGITKSIRDTEESNRLHNKLEDARTDKLLAEASKSDP
ncbi:MAG: YiaA/YiaB family inner membrane protein [Pseudomonadota bacterium]